MKCPHCGAETEGKYCSYCGSELPNNNIPPHESSLPAWDTPKQGEPQAIQYVQSHNITNNYYIHQAVPATASPVYNKPSTSLKSKDTAMSLCLVLGIFGIHYFYVGRWGKGVLYLFTLGLFGIGRWIDLFAIGNNHFKDSEGLPLVGTATWTKRIFFSWYSIVSLLAMLTNENNRTIFLIFFVFMLLGFFSTFRKKK